MQELDLSSNGIGLLGVESVAAYVAVNGSLTSVWTPAHEPSLLPISLSLKAQIVHICLQLDLSSNSIGGYYPPEAQSEADFISTPEGPKAIADALLVNAELTALDMRYNQLGDEGEVLLRQAVQRRSGFDLKLRKEDMLCTVGPH